MTQAMNSYIRIQGVIAALCNVVINPTLAWLLNRHAQFVSLSDIVVDTAITSVIMTLVVTLFTTSGVQRALKTGRLTVTDGFLGNERLLAQLPSRAWALGLILGLGTAVILIPVMAGLLLSLGFTGLPLVGFALFKAIYTGAMAFVIVRWVILRQLLSVSQT